MGAPVPRWASLLLISTQGVTNWGFRNALPSWLPLLCASAGFTDAQRALLMSSFFPGYILTQIPGSFAIQKYGAKIVLLVDMVVTATLCFCIPLATSTGGPRMLAPILTVIGLSQGPLIPALQVRKKDWLPAGPGRALILRLMSVPPMVSDMLATTIYPFICVKFGWQAFPYVHGVLTASFLVLWKLFVQDKPPLSPEEKALADAAKAKQAAEAKAKTIEWRIFTLPCVLSCMWAKFGSGVLSYALEQWGEIFDSTSYEPTMQQ